MDSNDRVPNRRRPRHGNETKHAADNRFSPDAYLRSLAMRQSQRERVRSHGPRPIRKRPKSPVLTLAERIVLARLDPENFSVQSTKSPEVQKAVSMTPRPSLSDLIRTYRFMHDSEQDLGQSMIDKVKETQDHMKRVESDFQQPIVSQGEASNSFINQSTSRTSFHGTNQNVTGHRVETPDNVTQQAIIREKETLSKIAKPEHSSPIFDAARQNALKRLSMMNANYTQNASPDPLTTNQLGDNNGNIENAGETGEYSKSQKHNESREYSKPSQRIHDEGDVQYTILPGIHGKSQVQTETDRVTECSSSRSDTTLPKIQNHRVHSSEKEGLIHTDTPLLPTLPPLVQCPDGTESKVTQGDIEIKAGTNHTNPGGVGSHQGTDAVISSAQEQIRNDNLSGDKHLNKYADTSSTLRQHTDLGSKSEQSGVVAMQHIHRDTSGTVGERYTDLDGQSKGLKPRTESFKNFMTVHEKEEIEDKQIFHTHSLQKTEHEDRGEGTHNAVVSAAEYEIGSVTKTEHLSNLPNHPEFSSDFHNINNQGRNTSQSQHQYDKENSQTSEQRRAVTNTTETDVAAAVRPTEKSETQPPTNAPHQHKPHPPSSPNSDVVPAEGKDNELAKEADTRSNATKSILPRADKSSKKPHQTCARELHIKADVNRFHSSSQTGAGISSGGPRPESITAREKEDRGDDEYSDQISIEINARGEVHISTYSEKKKVIDYSNDTTEQGCFSDNVGNEGCECDSCLSNSAQRLHRLHANVKCQKCNMCDNRTKRQTSLSELQTSLSELQTSLSERQTSLSETDSTRVEDSHDAIVIDLCHKHNKQFFSQSHSKFNEIPAKRPEDEHDAVTHQTGSDDKQELGHSAGQRNQPLNSQRKTHSHRRTPTASNLARKLSKSEFTPRNSYSDDNDDDDDDNDDRIYDFIGVSRRRSYTLPELVCRNSLPVPSIKPRHRLNTDGLTSLDRYKSSSVLQGVVSPHRQVTNRLGRSVEDSVTPSIKLPIIKGSNDVIPTSRSSKPGIGSSARDDVTLPRLDPCANLVGRKPCEDQPPNDRRDQRILGLYKELRHFNVFCKNPSTLQLSLTQRATDLDMRIEWGRSLPEGDNTLKLQCRAVQKPDSNNSKTKMKDGKSVKQPNMSYRNRNKFRRNYSKTFIFLDDDVLPNVELRHIGEGFCPDVTWFIQPGEASERCEEGFSAGRSRDRRVKAWMTLRNKCMPRVHIMKALETKTFGLAPKLKVKRGRGKT